MSRRTVFAILFLLLAAAAFIFWQNLQKRDVQPSSKVFRQKMEIKSSVFENNQKIPSKYTCDGENINPPLNFLDVPQDVKSLALIVDDPDAPGGTWTHWTVWNIVPTALEIPENSVPANAIEGTTSFGKVGYGSPCPPSGTHRYFFKVFALDTQLSLDQTATVKDLTQAIEGHILEQAELVGVYSREK